MNYNLDDVKSQIEKGEASIIDVREQEEWNEGHVLQALLAPLSQLDTGLEPTIDKTKRAYTYCRAGKRSYRARDILLSRGWTGIVALDEGFEELMARGFSRA